MKITAREKKLFKENRIVTIIRDKRDLYNVQGYLLDFSNDWILIQNISEFHLNGYSIVRGKDIKKIRYDSCDQYFEKILVKEGIRKKVFNKYSVVLFNLYSIFQSLKKYNINIIVECEEEKNDIFVIGSIEKVNKSYLTMRYFDACGKWIKKTKIIRYSEITIVRFDEEYTNIFTKYIEKT